MWKLSPHALATFGQATIAQNLARLNSPPCDFRHDACDLHNSGDFGGDEESKQISRDFPGCEEQAKQVGFIKDSAQELTEMVNDLLDLAKVEAGRITISPAWFEMVDLFSALRGMFRPILTSQSVDLVFEEPRNVPQLLPTTRSCRRSCATWSPTRSSSPRKARCAWRRSAATKAASLSA